MHTVFPGEFRRAHRTNEHLQCKSPYAYIDPSRSGIPPNRVVSGLLTEYTSEVTPSSHLAFAHQSPGIYASVVDAVWFTDFGARIAYGIPERDAYAGTAPFVSRESAVIYAATHCASANRM